MNTKNTRVFRIASLATLLTGGAWAQLAHPLVVDVPFDFSVGKTSLAAGEYQVRMQQPGVLRIATTDGKHAAMILAGSKVSNKPQSEARLMFNRYGNQYFLSQVWSAGGQTGVELPKTSAEVELARQINDKQDTAVVARKR